jgi:hypothetical protein
MERTGVKRETISMEVADHRAAQRLQGKFYAYRQAVKRELDLAKVQSDKLTDEQLQQLKDLWEWVQVTVCWFNRATPREAATTVSFMHRDCTPEARMLEDMLAANPETTPAPKPDEEASLQRLLEKLSPPPSTDKKYY